MSNRVFMLVLTFIAGASLAAEQSNPARTLVERALHAQGGEALKAIRTLEMEVAGHSYAIEQSERPEGPFIVIYEESKQIRDLSGRRVRIESRSRAIQGEGWSGVSATIVDGTAAARVAGERIVAGTRVQFENGHRALELSPERVLFTALNAADLRADADVAVHGMSQHVVSFGWRGRQVRLVLNPHDALLTAVEVIGPDPLFSMWGITTETTYLSYWNLEPGGFRYPRQIDVFWNGVTKSSSSITSLRVNAALKDGDFVIPDDVRQAFATAKPSGFRVAALNPGQAAELAPNVVQIPGSWNVTVIRQPDGIVVLEAPIGSEYSGQVIAEVARRFPDVKIKAAITTSDAWPHLGGVREYVANAVPIFALDLNRPILERLLSASYTDAPDALSKRAATPRFTWVSSKTVIGSGDTRLELYPIRGENGERMMMAYFPAYRLLYASDEIQRMRNGSYFMPEYLVETRDAIQRERLAVDRVFGMHLPMTPWADIEAAIAKASAPPEK